MYKKEASDFVQIIDNLQLGTIMDVGSPPWCPNLQKQNDSLEFADVCNLRSHHFQCRLDFICVHFVLLRANISFGICG